MNARRLALWVAVALLARPATAQEKAPPLEFPNNWYAQVLARGEVGLLNVTDFWSKGPKLRAETIIQGRRIVTIVNGDTYYAYDAVGRSGTAIARAPAAIANDAPDRRPFGNELEALRRQGAELVGEEDLGGAGVTEVYRITDSLGRRQVWVLKDERRLPLRVEIFRRKTGSTLHTTYTDWRRGVPLEDGFFQPEPGIALERLTLEEYRKRLAERTPTGPVPVLYTDLLLGP